MTTAPVHPVRSGPPQVAAGRGLTARQLADTARRVADTYPELLSTAEFDPTAVRRDEDDEVAIVRHVPVQSPRRVLLRLPALLGRPVAVIAHTTAPLVRPRGATMICREKGFPWLLMCRHRASPGRVPGPVS
jgi:hypothetical protein